ncbi:hypothetical protein EDEG_00454 [Edhazardia aedis USNM 41457]|uniref:Uncharacterized protein n=1 Tax=Edhazardia aedis (strain USNM 41457) TaxID=1003232 RepID=J9DJ44_EDHAE|nr:hypothetical protein EDEG_00454 [Edhazardia aedis USNM 41457]|eukprot:EJW01407.1 hypothetical protein EDEG_00454 [Edhazardia aedis USNM 41457]
MERSIQELIDNEDHEQISQVATNRHHKCVGLIHVEKFAEALKIANKTSFEYFYCLYKLKNYKKCLKKMRKAEREGGITGDPSGVQLLKAQCLYFTGKYLSAFRIFEKFDDSTICINTAAAGGLAIASKGKFLHKFKPEAKEFVDDKIEQEILSILKDKEIDQDDKQEFDFNLTFKDLNDESKFIETLEQNSENKMVSNQLKNVTGDFENLDESILTKRSAEIVKANKLGVSDIENPTLFHKKNRDYQLFFDIQKNGFKEALKDRRLTEFTLLSKVMACTKVLHFEKAQKILEEMNGDSVLKRNISIILDKNSTQDQIKSILANLEN